MMEALDLLVSRFRSEMTALAEQPCSMGELKRALLNSDQLTNNISDYDNGNGCPVVISGRFEDEIEKLLINKRGANVFLYIDPYGIKALDSRLFQKFSSYGFNSIELLINMNSFGFFRDACRVMKVDYGRDEALYDLDDIVEFEPTEVDDSFQSEVLLTNIAGGDYWKEIVKEYHSGKIDGYKAEQKFSTEYKRRLQKIIHMCWICLSA